jgi:hypothetical protein
MASMPADELHALSETQAAHRHPLRTPGVILLVFALICLAVWFASRHVRDGKLYRVSATVDLRGAPCRSHSSDCAGLANGGSVVIFGPEQANVATFPKHRVRLDGETTKMKLMLAPGKYLFAFDVLPPYSILLPNFGDGTFYVGARPVDLGVVRPSPTWVVEGD